jgi:SAM-dependent methyltransferase
MSMLSPADVYDHALTRPGSPMRAHFSDGSSRGVAIDRWLGPATAEERAALDDVRGPVLDIGCGAGRHVLELQRRGVAVLGIDVASHAVSIARGRGAAVLHRSVFAGVPDEGKWASALLLDGNIGIGGDPSSLLRRVHELLRPGGCVLVEVEPRRGAGGRGRVRVEGSAGVSHWFPWGRLCAGDVEAVSAAAGFALRARRDAAGRCFCRLRAERDARTAKPGGARLPR